MSSRWGAKGLVITRVQWRPERAIMAARAGSSAALRDAADMVLREANETVPIVTGFLMRSGRTGLIDESTAHVSYDAVYAVAVHEGFPVHGERKWLEHALKRIPDKFFQTAAVELRKRLSLPRGER